MNSIIQRVIDSIRQPRYYLPLFLLILLIISPLGIRNPFYQHVIVMIFFHAALSAAWNIIGGFAGQLSLGHVAFFGIGAYTSTLLFLRYSLSPWMGMILGAILASITAILIGYPCFRLRGPFFTLSTIAFAEVIRIVAITWRDLTQGSVGLWIPFKPSLANFVFRGKVSYAYIALVFMLIVLWVSFVIKKSRLGHYLIALREDEDAAEALGVNTLNCKLIAVMISAFFTAMGGIFYAQYVLFIEPYSVFAIDISVQLALIAIIGGIGTVMGPIVGSFLVTPLVEFLRAWLGGAYRGLHFTIYGCILILVVILIPQGIIEWMRKSYEALLKKLPEPRVKR